MKDTYEMCRLCLAKDQVNVHIFEGKGNEEQLLLKISTCLPIQISRGDKFPKKICGMCSDKVNVMFLFWNTSVISELKLLEWSQQNCKIRKSAKAKIRSLRNSDMETDRNDQEVEDLLRRKRYNKRVKTKKKRLRNRKQSRSAITIQDDDASAATSKVNSPVGSVTPQGALSTKETSHVVESVEIVEEEPGSSIPDTQDLPDDLVVQEEVCIEEVGDTVEWNEVAEEEPVAQDLQQDLLVQEEVSTEEVDNVVEIVEEEPATTTTDMQDLQYEFTVEEEVSIDEFGDTVEWREVVEEEPGNYTVDSHDHFPQEVDNAGELSKIVVDEESGNTREDSKVLQQDDVSIEELSNCNLTTVEVVSSNAVEEVRSSSTLGFQNNTQEDDLAQELLEFANEQNVHTVNEKVVEETGISTTDAQNLQVQEEVSIEEVSHLTTLEIISNDTGEESSNSLASINGFQDDSFIQELEVSHEETVPAVELRKPVKKKLWKVTAVTRKISLGEGRLKPESTPCIVPTCNGKKNNTRRVFHPLPADDEIRKLWLELISRHDLLKKPYSDLQKERVCGAHFEPSQYYNKSKVKRHHCIVPDCDGRSNNVRHTWHSLPHNKELREKWLTVLNRHDLLEIDGILKKNLKVCSAHFNPSQYRCPSSDFLNARSIPKPMPEHEGDLMLPSTTNGTMLPPVTPSTRPISRQKRPISRQKRPISRQKRRRRDERVLVKSPTTNGTMLRPVTPLKRPLSRQNRRRRDQRKPVKLITMDPAMLPPVIPSRRPSSRQMRQRLGEREPVKPLTTNSTMLPLVTLPKRPSSRQMRRLRGAREPVKPLTTNSTMLPFVALPKRPSSRQMRRLRGEREPVKSLTMNSTMLPLVTPANRPLSQLERRLRDERKPVKPLTTNSTMLPLVTPTIRPLSRLKRRLRAERQSVKPSIINDTRLPLVLLSKLPISEQERRLTGEREPVKPPTTGSTMSTPPTPSKGPIRGQKRRFQDDRKPVKSPSTRSTMLSPVTLKRPLSRQKRRLRGEREPMKPPIANSTMLPPITPSSRHKRKCRELSSQLTPPTKVYSPRKKLKIDEQ